MRTFVFSPRATFGWVLFVCLWSSNYAQQSRCFNELGAAIYSPCVCDGSGEGNLNVTCLGDLVTYQEIQKIFEDSTALVINRFALVPAVSGSSNIIEIIDDLLSNKRARVIEIATCPPASTLQISPNAFRNSKIYTQEFSITDCDIDQLNWAFLQNFSQIINVRLTTVSGIHSFSSLPPLRNAAQLTFDSCSGFDNPLPSFPAASLPALKRLDFVGNADLSNPVADSIVLALASNGVQLQNLTIRQSSLITLVPVNIGGILSLTSIDLSNNKITFIDSNSLSFLNDRSVQLIDLSSNTVDIISANAFSTGNYGGAIVPLDNNLLTLFEWDVFLEVLVEMKQSGSGLVSIAGNGISCTDCHLAWLIRDNPDLLQYVSGGTCSDGIAFEDLSPSDYGSTCAVITPSPATTSTTVPTTTTTPTTTESTENSTTENSTTENSTTENPTTENPTTENPTTENPTTETPTTETPTPEATTTTTTTTTTNTTAETSRTTAAASTSTEAISTTIGPNNNDNTQLLLYITCGLVALILLILIIGCTYMMITKNSRKQRRKSLTSVSSNGFSARSGPPPIPVNNTLPGVPRSNYGTQGPSTMPRANIPPIVQGPGGKLYVQSTGAANTNAANTNAANNATKSQKPQTQGKSTTRQGY